ncbi:chemotaxis protein CheB [Luteibacter pinisoli]|uniref:protein-glutamate methylesterase n=1 Tax=Luteibacter pinisoli TaxID=2589080 RepID=A0A4Y5Z504_9GAMM|nr:chemotaxis protein CheB [Luteibacter pinisoli]QDE39629.1 chemotaxis protein CheB [Luteibacter pinisoli]
MSTPFPQAVVIGASAGGVQALREVLRCFPARFPAPVLVVQHIPRDRPSGLAALFDGECPLPVAEAEDKEPLCPGVVLFAPPDYHLLVEDRSTVSLSRDEPVLYSRPAIDPLFESAADVFGAGLLGILLTGASSDGSAGVAAVRREGGTVWIQDPDEAVSPVMPASAIAFAGADAIVTLRDLCRRLGSFTP